MRIRVAGAVCTSVSTDSRTLSRGALFVALKGDRSDGHDFVAAAFANGAAAAVVGREIPDCGPQLVVPDTLTWLQEEARVRRIKWGGKVVAITGSAGKTLAKDSAAAVLSTHFRTGKTSGNFNNHIGVPLSILNLEDDAEVAVLEIGMNHAGEISHLARIARPDVGLVTNVGTAHIAYLGSIEAIALAKRELIEALPPDGIAILNADDDNVRSFAAIHHGRILYYGLSEAAHVRALNVEYAQNGSRFTVPDVGTFFCPLPARGGLMAALAALAVGRAFGIDLWPLRHTIASLQPPGMRLQRIERGGLLIWDDSYNSNPEAAIMMLDLLAATPAPRRIAVLGEMLELGPWSEDLHRRVGSHAARCGLSVLIAIRGAARHLADAAVLAGLEPGAAYFFDEPQEAGRFLRTIVKQGDALLFKGSRGTRVETAIEVLFA